MSGALRDKGKKTAIFFRRRGEQKEIEEVIST